MADFNQAIQWLKEGKDIIRKSWEGKSTKGYKPHYKDYRYSLEDFEATDWEIYCEECDFESEEDHIPLPGGKVHIFYRKICRNCGIEKPEELEPKTLKDFFTHSSGSSTYYNGQNELSRLLKESAVQDIKILCKDRSSNEDFSKKELRGIDRYIKWKFNITEEDLK